MSIITLTTDFGNKDFFVASVKGAILSGVKNALIIDISHEIQPYNHSEAAYVLKNAYKTFPKGTIHIIGVESELTPENRHIAMLFEGHYFIGSDNGIFSMIKDDLKAEKIVEINIHENESPSFYVLDAFVKVASHLSRMGKLEVIGKAIKTIKQITNINPVVNNKENQILGSVIYIDNYGNVVTNINRKFFNEIGKSKFSFLRNTRSLLL